MNRLTRLVGASALLALASCGAEVPGPQPLPIDTHIIYAEIAPDSSYLSCQDVLTVDLGRRSAGRFFFFLNRSLSVDRIEDGGGEISYRRAAAPDLSLYLDAEAEEDEDLYSNAAVIVMDLPSGGGNIPEEGPRSLVVTYSGAIYDSLRVPDYSRGAEAEETKGLIDERGTFLSPATHWYPDSRKRKAVFNVTTVTPAGYHTVTQGRLALRETLDGRVKTVWKGEHPSEEAYLVAGPYDVRTLDHSGIQICTYFYESEADLSESYLQACAGYIDMYNELLGQYPYSKFAVVENFFPTGYGMPSYTLLGRRVLRLPFIIHTSLGHEIAHNWWGNGVYVDPDEGNWCEGLTTYCADYRYKLLQGEDEAREYRADINRDYTVYVDPRTEIPLADFKGRTTSASRAIGYGKCAMVFHMLERIMGEEAFYGTLRTIVSKYMFKQIGWSQIEREFSTARGEDLKWFFDQWVRGKGAPELSITKAVAVDDWPDYTLSIRLEQEGGPFRLSVPVVIHTEGGLRWKKVEMDGPVAEASFKFSHRPKAVDVDSGQNVMRRMAPDEIAPTLAMVLGDRGTIVVEPGGASDGAAAAYAALASRLSRTGEATVVRDVELSKAQADSHSLFILGSAGQNSALGLFAGEWPGKVFPKAGTFTVHDNTYTSPGDCALFVGRNPGDPGRTIAILGGLSEEAVTACTRKVIHYGKYGYVVFTSGEAVDKGTWDVRAYPRRTVRLIAIG
jgi:aminopeptidase N